MQIESTVLIYAGVFALVYYAIKKNVGINLDFSLLDHRFRVITSSTNDRSKTVRRRKSFLAKSALGDVRREVRVTVGKRYKVEPLNPNKKYMRGRTVVVEGFYGDPPRYARVKYDLTASVGKILVWDLVSAD